MRQTEPKSDIIYMPKVDLVDVPKAIAHFMKPVDIIPTLHHSPLASASAFALHSHILHNEQKNCKMNADSHLIYTGFQVGEFMMIHIRLERFLRGIVGGCKKPVVLDLLKF